MGQSEDSQLPLPLGHEGKYIYKKCEGRHDITSKSESKWRHLLRQSKDATEILLKYSLTILCMF